MDSTRGLDNIPTELTRKIASYLPLKALLNLRRVSHRLRDACDDFTVYQGMAENNSNNIPGRGAWKLNLFNMEEAKWYVLAEVRTRDILGVAVPLEDRDSTFTQIGPRGFRKQRFLLRWLPHLSILQHPSACRDINSSSVKRPAFRNWQIHVREILLDNPNTLWPTLGEWHTYVYTTLAMEAGSFPGLPIPDNLEPKLDFASDADEWFHIELLTIFIWRLASLHLPHGKPDQILMLAYQALAAIGYRIRKQITFTNLKRFPKPPLSTSIPLLAHYGGRIPRPFDRSSNPWLYEGYLDTMVRKEFLEDGLWEGYQYHNSYRFDALHPTELMTLCSNIRFDATSASRSQSDSEVAHFDITATMKARDESKLIKGRMKLDGRMRWNVGAVEWHGIMTPFGIVATSRPNQEDEGEETDDGSRDWIWLWKTAWTQTQEKALERNSVPEQAGPVLPPQESSAGPS